VSCIKGENRRKPLAFQTGSGIGYKNNRRNNDTIAISPKIIEATG